jgi:hypothetical protein
MFDIIEEKCGDFLQIGGGHKPRVIVKCEYELGHHYPCSFTDRYIDELKYKITEYKNAIDKYVSKAERLL